MHEDDRFPGATDVVFELDAVKGSAFHRSSFDGSPASPSHRIDRRRLRARQAPARPDRPIPAKHAAH
jgi:hypothetical protein